MVVDGCNQYFKWSFFALLFEERMKDERTAVSFHTEYDFYAFLQLHL